jgi:hypothetical protein
MRHDVMSVQTLSLLHIPMIVAALSTAAPLTAHQRSSGSTQQFAAQIGEFIRAIHARISSTAPTKIVAI